MIASHGESALFVETDSLGKRYGPLAALDQCTFSVRRGEVFGLLGPNGSGKTTLLRLLLGYLRPSSGRATIGGLDCDRKSIAVRKLVSYLPGEPRLYRGMRGRNVLRFFAGIRPGGDFQRAEKVADRLELDLSRRVAFMSTGMRQKLALAIALSADTPLLILDEPTSNLDPTVRGALIQMIGEAKEAGRTVLFSSHVLSEVEEVCSRVAILRLGKLVHTQTISELHRKHRLRAKLSGELPELPAELEGCVTMKLDEAGDLVIEAEELPPLFSWLATLSVKEIRAEAIGLRAVYDQFHAGESDAE